MSEEKKHDGGVVDPEKLKQLSQKLTHNEHIININIPDIHKHLPNIQPFFDHYKTESLDSQIANINVRIAESNKLLGRE